MYRLNHRVPMAVFQSDRWQMTQIAQLGSLKFKMAFSVITAKLAHDVYLKEHLITRRKTTPERSNHSFFISKTCNLYSYLHYKEVKCLTARPKNVWVCSEVGEEGSSVFHLNGYGV